MTKKRRAHGQPRPGSDPVTLKSRTPPAGGRDLVHLDGIPRMIGFKKTPSGNPGGGSLLEECPALLKRGIFGERTFNAFTAT